MKSLFRTLNFVIACSVSDGLANLAHRYLVDHLILPVAVCLYGVLEYIDDRIERRRNKDNTE